MGEASRRRDCRRGDQWLVMMGAQHRGKPGSVAGDEDAFVRELFSQRFGDRSRQVSGRSVQRIEPVQTDPLLTLGETASGRSSQR